MGIYVVNSGIWGNPSNNQWVTTPNRNVVGATFLSLSLLSQPGVPISNIGDSLGNIYTLAKQYSSGAGNLSFWYNSSPNIGNPMNFGANFTGSGEGVLGLVAAGGVAPTPVDKYAGNFTAGGPANGTYNTLAGPITPSTNGALVVSMMQSGNVAMSGLAAPFGSANNVAYTPGYFYAAGLAWYVQPTVAAIGANWTYAQTANTSEVLGGIIDYVQNPCQQQLQSVVTDLPQLKQFVPVSY
jgi:hypothetical protein